ncbi:hypothetical protein HS088_TW14G00424 [Tripterygium wilfordii]|uniref:Senescence regulator n=1 Tax=Tripterygium wilfordii TaxID=458696 RepID=A0A7J7CQ98_TRIWF|nr:uncharacterized protein LOC120015469 [Tripterygium wilfordii]KAF5736285.1 hypothetical protein HS088_TW14G00424 [Tripterygium wilfordii]
MAEVEFQESEVIFVQDRHDCRKTTRCDVQEDDANHYFSVFTKHNLCKPSGAKKNDDNNNKSKKKSISSSVPVSIPDTALQFTYGDENEAEDDGELVPPHVIVGRRIAREMAFSVCTLKGRDLSRVRNSILRMTGFLEAETA